MAANIASSCYNVLQISRAIFIGRGSYRDKLNVTVSDRSGNIGGKL